jgi:hypothetical protein
MNSYPKTDTAIQARPLTDRVAQHLGVTEAILRNRRHFFEEIRDNVSLQSKIQAMLVASATFLALYGAVMGSSHSPLQAMSSAVKLPVLFLITSIICLPTLYFFNLLFGAKQSLTQNLALILIPITVTAVILFSFAPITLFFMLTTSDYQFFKLLNVVFFGVSGITGMLFLVQGMQVVSADDEEGARARRLALRFWIIIFAFVGSQMAWTLRPFMGFPSAPFELVRQLGGNFYADILASIGEILGFFIVR